MDIKIIEEAKALLQIKKLKRTPLRVAMLTQFLEAEHLLSYNDLYPLMAGKVDKSTIYRNLTSFEASGLIHGMDDSSGQTKYGYTQRIPNKERHAHFVCEECQNVYCIDIDENSSISLPRGFSMNARETILKGVCPKC